MNASTIRLPLGIAAALAALAVSAPAATATDFDIDPDVYATDVLPGQVEHGVYSFTVTGSRMPANRRIEYWISADRWRDQTTDADTGELIAGRLHDAGGTTWLQYKQINSGPRILHFKGNDSVPGPGYPAAYNRKLVEKGDMQGSEQFPVMVTLQPIGPQTIAGFKGTAYEQLSNGEPGLARMGNEPKVESHSTLVLENRTLKPLMRETTVSNGSAGTLVQRETLISRETTSAANASVQLTKLGFARTVTKWKAKVKAAKKAAAKKKQHGKK